MARGSLSVEGIDGGIGQSGPLGPSPWAAVGVASGAAAIGTQMPIVVTSPSDVETLIGIGPLRDALVIALSRVSVQVVVVPLVRSTGGGVIVAAQTGGTVVTTAVGGHAIGGQHVRLECTLGGAAGTAAFRLIVDGVAAAVFTPASADFSSAIVLTAAQLGSLATGVATADYFAPTITTHTAFVSGDAVTFQMSEAKAAGADMDPAITKLVDQPIIFRFLGVTGRTTPATHALVQTKARAITSEGHYVRALVQGAGPDALTEAATAATTAAWVSALSLATSPVRMEAPRIGICVSHGPMRDPITDRRKLAVPTLYPLLGALAAREPWEPVDAVRQGGEGRLQGVEGIYPANLSGDNIDALDDSYYITTQTHPGERGVFVTHGRLWGQPPAPGIDGTDYTGIERGLTMDEACRRVRRLLAPRLNDNVDTDQNGRLSPAEREDIRAASLRGLRSLQSVGAIRAPEVTVKDTGRGILFNEKVQVQIRFIPFGKASSIEATIQFYAGPPATSDSTEETA